MIVTGSSADSFWAPSALKSGKWVVSRALRVSAGSGTPKALSESFGSSARSASTSALVSATAVSKTGSCSAQCAFQRFGSSSASQSSQNSLDFARAWTAAALVFKTLSCFLSYEMNQHTENSCFPPTYLTSVTGIQAASSDLRSVLVNSTGYSSAFG